MVRASSSKTLCVQLQAYKQRSGSSDQICRVETALPRVETALPTLSEFIKGREQLH